MKINLPTPDDIIRYRNGGEGFIAWANENCWMNIYPTGAETSVWVPMGDLPKTPDPQTGRSYHYMWHKQQEHLLKALEMKDGRFLHRLIILCWMRGEGKSAVAGLIQTWKFFCWPKQQIVLGANSKEQTKFIHYDIIRTTILHSPRLLAAIGGAARLQEKQITLRDAKGNPASAIRTISSAQGIVSNITGYTFSEMHLMKNFQFFTQLDGSTRNVPNALGVIDTTVSDKSHILHSLYETYIADEDPTLFFSYRFSENADFTDFYHPQMSQQQLDSYRAKFPFGEFDRYFKNKWDAGAVRIFRPEEVEAINYLGTKADRNDQEGLLTLLREQHELKVTHKQIADDLLPGSNEVVDHGDGVKYQRSLVSRMVEIAGLLNPVDKLYRFTDNVMGYKNITIEELNRLSDMFDTDWSIHSGLDRADPMSLECATRTGLVTVAKGLPGSRSGWNGLEGATPYIYFVVGITVFKQHNLDDIKRELERIHIELDGVDTLGSEKWGTWDLQGWCEEIGIHSEFIAPTYERQRTAFNQFYTLVTTGLFKSPIIPIPGSVGSDILKEEMSIFYHDEQKKWFGSPEKGVKTGIQDDIMYATNWAIYSGRDYTCDNFRKRGFGGMQYGYLPNEEVLGAY